MGPKNMWQKNSHRFHRYGFFILAAYVLSRRGFFDFTYYFRLNSLADQIFLSKIPRETCEIKSRLPGYRAFFLACFAPPPRKPEKLTNIFDVFNFEITEFVQIFIAVDGHIHGKTL